MDIWASLGIESTKDENAITDAYRAKLRLVHPEEHPEEFMELRKAYEEALAQAREEDKEEDADLTPVGMWVKRAQDIYFEFSERVDTECWKELLEDEVCQSLDSRQDAMEGLLAFFMEHFYLPRRVWQLLDGEFDFQGNVKDLYERFPKSFIDNVVIDGINADVIISYDLFDPGTTGDIDPYFELYFKARREIRDGNYEAAEATIKDLEATGIEHPNTDFIKARLLWVQKKMEEALAIADELVEYYPDVPAYRQLRAETLQDMGDFDGAIQECERILEIREKDFAARLTLAECLKGKGELAKARDKLIDLGNESPYDPYITNLIDETVAQLKEENLRKLNEGDADFETVMEYLWTCLQSQDYDKAKELRTTITPETLPQKADYENFSTKLFTNALEPEQALEHALLWYDYVEQLPEGETDEEKKRKGKPGEILYLQANALLGLERYEECIEKANESEALRPKEVVAADVRRRAYLELHDYENAVAEARKMVGMQPNMLSYYFLGSSLYEAGRKTEAYGAFEEAQRYQLDLTCFIMRIRILCDYGQWDDAKAELDYLEENGAKNDCIDFLRARIRAAEGDEDGALEVYRRLVAKAESEEGSDIFFPWELYNLTAELEEDHLKPKEILALVDKGLETKSDYLPLMNYRAFLLRKLDRNEEALEAYLALYARDPKQRTVNKRIGNLYYDEFDEYEKALEFYGRQLELLDDASVRELAGLCYLYLDRFDEAKAEIQKSIDLDPSVPRPYCNLGLCHERQYDFEGAIPYHEEAVSVNMAKEDPDGRDPSIHMRFARCLSRAGRNDEAITMYLEGAKLFGRRQDVEKAIDVALKSMKLVNAEKVLRSHIDPTRDADVYFEKLAKIRKMQGDEREFLRCLEAMPNDNAMKYCHLADYYETKDRPRKAQQYWQRMGELEPDHLSYLHGYSSFLHDQGKEAEALEFGQRMLDKVETYSKRKWEYGFYLTEKAFALTCLSRYEEALECAKKALEAPLCDFCIYSRCKDAYLAMALIYVRMGYYALAQQTCFEGMQLAPDDTDFSNILAEMKRKKQI